MMKTYLVSSRCPKCDTSGATTHFHEAMYRTIAHPDRDPEKELVEPARMQRRCRRCKHAWFEEPLDADTEPMVDQVAECEKLRRVTDLVTGWRIGPQAYSAWDTMWAVAEVLGMGRAE